MSGGPEGDQEWHWGDVTGDGSQSKWLYKKECLSALVWFGLRALSLGLTVDMLEMIEKLTAFV